jgi:DNA-binding transcriptional regulator WhiA
MHHRHATLQELGRLADPSLSKDTVAGRLHRLVVPKDMHGVTPGR